MLEFINQLSQLIRMIWYLIFLTWKVLNNTLNYLYFHLKRFVHYWSPGSCKTDVYKWSSSRKKCWWNSQVSYLDYLLKVRSSCLLTAQESSVGSRCQVIKDLYSWDIWAWDFFMKKSTVVILKSGIEVFYTL